jgi:hypothetical protein
VVWAYFFALECNVVLAGNGSVVAFILAPKLDIVGPLTCVIV